MNYQRTLVGFHGCDMATAVRLAAGDPWIPSKNDYDWLGHGIYFWEGDYDRALDWAMKVMQNPRLSKARIRTAAVVAVVIEPRNMLDLSLSKSMPIIEEAYEYLCASMERQGLAMPENEPVGSADIYFKNRKLGCMVMNTVNIMLRFQGKPEIDLFRAPFNEGAAIYAGGMFYRDTHIQLCVKDPSIIKSAYNASDR